MFVLLLFCGITSLNEERAVVVEIDELDPQVLGQTVDDVGIADDGTCCIVVVAVVVDRKEVDLGLVVDVGLVVVVVGLVVVGLVVVAATVVVVATVGFVVVDSHQNRMVETVVVDNVLALAFAPVVGTVPGLAPVPVRRRRQPVSRLALADRRA